LSFRYFYAWLFTRLSHRSQCQNEGSVRHGILVLFPFRGCPRLKRYSRSDTSMYRETNFLIWDSEKLIKSFLSHTEFYFMQIRNYSWRFARESRISNTASRPRCWLLKSSLRTLRTLFSYDFNPICMHHAAVHNVYAMYLAKFYVYFYIRYVTLFITRTSVYTTACANADRVSVYASVRRYEIWIAQGSLKEAD